MVQQRIESLRATLREVLFLDIDEFGLEAEGDTVRSKFIGLWLDSAFQPIFRPGGTVPFAYEALLRPAIGADPADPLFAFEFADKRGKLVHLDRVARTLHVLNFLQLCDVQGLLFLNVHPKLVASVSAHGKVFEQVLHSRSVPTSRVVIEIEESAVEVDRHLFDAADNYRDRRYKLAVKGFGGRRSTLERVWRLAPDYVKLDVGLIRYATTNAKFRNALPHLVSLVGEMGAQAIVTGIENATQHAIAVDAGAPLLQGFHLGRPECVSPLRGRPDGPAADACIQEGRS